MLAITSCSCGFCKKMCLGRPCWPTFTEAKALVNAGFGNRLMNDYWDGYTDPKAPPKPDYNAPGYWDWSEKWERTIHCLCPASKGEEGVRASFFPMGCCLQNAEGLCELHDLGLKPMEAQLANCKASKEERQELGRQREFVILPTWDTPEARKFIDDWREHKL